MSDGALSIAVAALQQIAQLGSEERDRVTARAALDCIDALGGTREALAPVAVIEFNERPIYTLEEASTQVEHLYIHAGLHAEAINALVERVNVLTGRLSARGSLRSHDRPTPRDELDDYDEWLSEEESAAVREQEA